jgi:hypothetical protein
VVYTTTADTSIVSVVRNDSNNGKPIKFDYAHASSANGFSEDFTVTGTLTANVTASASWTRKVYTFDDCVEYAKHFNGGAFSLSDPPSFN